MSIKIGASAPKGVKGRRTSPPGIMPPRPAKKIEGGQSLAIHIYKIGIHPVALPPHPCLPQGGKAYSTREASARPQALLRISILVMSKLIAPALLLEILKCFSCSIYGVFGEC